MAIHVAPSDVTTSAAGPGPVAPGRSRSGSHSFWSVVAPGVAATLVFLLGLREFLLSGVTLGDVAVVLLAPVWFATLARARTARLVAIVGVVTVVWGILLRSLSATDHAVNTSVQISSSVLLAGLVLGTAALVWARTLLTAGQVGLVYGLGMLARGVMDGPGGNPWKNTWGIPVAIVVLSAVLLARERRPSPRSTVRRPTPEQTRPRVTPGFLALVVLAALSAVNDSRSYAGTFVIAGTLLVWQARPAILSRRSSASLTAAFLGVLAASVYWLGSHLLVAGYLGADAQARSIAQIDQSGSLILGGRPELEATLALMRDRPAGFGVGVIPTPRDVLVAKSGLASINYDPNNGYVDKYMFGGRIELHSLFGDLWASWGLAGLALLVLMVVVVLRGVSMDVARRRGDPLLLFLGVWTLWNFFFSPLYSTSPTLMLTLALVLSATDAPSRRKTTVGVSRRPRSRTSAVAVGLRPV